MRARLALLAASLLFACHAPVDERATEDGTVEHPRCESCHASAFEEADDPPHSGELPTTCFVCHTQDDWTRSVVQHDFFPLTGAHDGARCFNCHIIRQGDNEPRFEGIDGDCVDCHRGDYERAQFPGHSHFALTCADCHSTSAWSPTLHPPPDAWVDVDAGVPAHHHHHDAAVGADAGVHLDAGHRAHTTHTTRPPPTTTTPPPPTTTTRPPPTTTTWDPGPDVTTRPSRRR